MSKLLTYNDRGLIPGYRDGSHFAGVVIFGQSYLIEFLDPAGVVLGSTVARAPNEFESSRVKALRPVGATRIKQSLIRRVAVELIDTRFAFDHSVGRQICVTCS